MSRSSKGSPASDPEPRPQWQTEQLREMQSETLQGLLFSLVELGEQSAFLQLELDGVLHYVAARKLTQAEFDDLVRQAVCDRQP